MGSRQVQCEEPDGSGEYRAEVYKTIPTYTTTSYPDFFAPAYRTTTYKYYGLTPGQLRRLNRIVRP